MRSTKYHDYRVLKIALFIILVILGLFIYIKCTRALHEHTATQWTTITEATCTEDGLEAKICTDPECEGARFDERIIPATGHTESNKWTTVKNATCTEQGVETKLCKDCGLVLDTRYTDILEHNTAVRYENVDPATCTENGSRDVVTYCKDCGHVTGSDIETLPATGHSYIAGSETYDVSVAPTHTQGGVELIFKDCSNCGETILQTEVNELDPLGHSYTWEIKGSEAGEFTIEITCDCDEDGNYFLYDETNGLTATLDTTVPSCCRKLYNLTVTLPDGTVITDEIEVEPDPHSVWAEVLDPETSEVVDHVYAHITKYAKEDDKGYYYIYKDVKDVVFLNYEENTWDANGFAYGTYKCAICEDHACAECNGDYWYIVRIYNPKYDTRLSGESVDD